MKDSCLINYHVVLLEAVRSFDQFYTYSSTTPLQLGERVLVPFGPKDEPKEAVVFGKSPGVEGMKPIIRRLDTAPIARELIQSLKEAEEYYVAPIGALVKLALPKAVRHEVAQEFTIVDETLPKDVQEKVLQQSLPGKELQRLVEEGAIFRTYSASLTRLPTERFLKLLNDKRLIDYQATLSSRQKLLHHTIEWLLEEELIPLEQRLTKKHVDELLASGAVQQFHLPKLPLGSSSFQELTLTDEQAKVAKDLSSGSHLIYGVPASGKTHLVMHQVRACLASGKQALILVPEQLMAEHLHQRLSEVFSEPIAMLHGRVSDGALRRQYHWIQEGTYRIVVGTRNALFAPFQSLGLIAVDDFHDDAFYSDEPPVDFRRIAIDYAQRLNIPVLLSSSTPDLLYLSDTSLTKHYLASPYENYQRRFHLVDMRQQVMNEAHPLLSTDLLHRLNQKTLLFLNRIGYAGFVLCHRCGQVISCPQCQQAMLYHQSSQRLQCRQCGISQTMPKQCPNCQGETFEFSGMGIERLDEILRERYPEKKITRFDSHSLRLKQEREQLTKRLHEADILLATQILTKGYEIPDLTVVGLLSPDTMLYTPEFRSREKCFQTVLQVAGRVGRTSPGDVYLQTYTPENDVYQKAVNQDVQGFYRQEYQLRKLHGLPPHRHVIKLVVAHQEQAKVASYATKLAELLKSRFEYEVFGPYQGMFEKVGAFYRYHLYLKADNTMDDLKDFLRGLQPRGQIRLMVVVDPLTLLY